MSDEQDDEKGIEELNNVLAFSKPFDRDADIRDARHMIHKPDENLPRCLCRSVYVVEQYRNCECRQCGRIIEAFDWLFSRAKEDGRVEWDLKSVQEETERRRDSLERLKQSELNTRGRIKRAEFKLNDLETAVWKLEQRKKELKAELPK